MPNDDSMERANHRARFAHYAAIISLVALTTLAIAWEGVLAPLRPGGSMLVWKAFPLLLAFFGVLRGRIYTYQWASMLILAYFAEGIVRAFSEPSPVRPLALAEVVLSLIFFVAALIFIRERRRHALNATSPD